MANIFDYLKWRGDIPFSADPFNDIDNLILSELAYTDFMIPDGGEDITVKDEAELYFADHSHEEILDNPIPIAKAPLLLEYMSSGGRFADTVLSGYINEIDREKNTQISAVTYILGDGSIYIAFRGTDDSIVGWKEDFDLSYLSETGGQRRAVEYLNEIAQKTDKTIRVGGHSKGGNFAVYASSFCDPAVQDRIAAVYSNDGPGFRKEIVDSEGYLRILPKIVSIIPDTSIIGMILANSYNHTVIRSSSFGIMQHDPLTWSVVRNRFEKAEKSETGVIVEKVLGEWLESISDETRRSITYSLFSLLEATGKSNFQEMGSQKLKCAEAVLSAIAGLQKEKRRELTKYTARLLKIGGQTLTAKRPKKAEKSSRFALPSDVLKLPKPSETEKEPKKT